MLSPSWISGLAFCLPPIAALVGLFVFKASVPSMIGAVITLATFFGLVWRYHVRVPLVKR
jgi:hypothetical protein